MKIKAVLVLTSVLMARITYADCSLKAGTFSSIDGNQFVTIAQDSAAKDPNYLISYYDTNLVHLKTEIWSSVVGGDANSKLQSSFYTCDTGLVVVVSASDPYASPRYYFQDDTGVYTYTGLNGLRDPVLIWKPEPFLSGLFPELTFPSSSDLKREQADLHQPEPSRSSSRKCSVSRGTFTDVVTGHQICVIPQMNFAVYHIHLYNSDGVEIQHDIWSGSIKTWFEQNQVKPDPRSKNLLFACDESTGALILMDPSTSIRRPQILLQNEKGIGSYPSLTALDKGVLIWEREKQKKVEKKKRPISPEESKFQIVDQSNSLSSSKPEKKLQRKIPSLLPNGKVFKPWRYEYDINDTVEVNGKVVFLDVKLAEKLNLTRGNLKIALERRGIAMQNAYSGAHSFMREQNIVFSGTKFVTFIDADDFLKFVE
jgi:hypothetical protein